MNVENLTLTSAATNAAGNALGNQLTGNGIANILDGRTGNDTLRGGGGNDLYIVDKAGDVVDEQANTDTDDEVKSASVLLAAITGIEHYTFTGTNATGNVGINHLIGNDGANKLDGGGAADILDGGKGSDTYEVNDPGDQVVESVAGAAGGVDLVRSTVDFELTFNVEKLTLLGSDDIDALGNNLNNTLIGNAGANIIDGSTGNDTMTGGKGDDTYIVDAAGDTVIEAAGGGTDLVQSSVTYSIATRVNVENLELTGAGNIAGTGNALANIITGNDGDNTLNGAAGNDTITGGDGIDRLTGGTGRDIFDYNLVSDAGDTITDFAKGANGDALDLRDILDNAGYVGADPFGDGILSFTPSGANTLIQIDADGGGGNPAVTVVTLNNVALTQVDTANFLV